MTNQLSLFITAFLQVALVSMNVMFISVGHIAMMLVTGFLISLVWTLNVKRVAFGMWRDRFVYATGAMFGTLIGYLLSKYLITIL